MEWIRSGISRSRELYVIFHEYYEQQQRNFTNYVLDYADACKKVIYFPATAMQHTLHKNIQIF